MKIVKIKSRKETDKKDSFKKTRIYFFPQGEKLLDNLNNRHFRPHKEYRKLLPEIAKQLGMTQPIDVTWSQKAGCGCGCSPGFIMQSGSTGRSIYVTVEGE